MVGVAEHDLGPQVARARAGSMAFTLALVPTGMKTGVRARRAPSCSTPARAVAVGRDDRRSRRSQDQASRRRTSRSGTLARSPHGTARRVSSTPANAITSASSVERGQMEVGDHRAHRPEAVARRDEQPGAPGERPGEDRRTRSRARARRWSRPRPPAGRLRARSRSGRRRRPRRVALGVDLVARASSSATGRNVSSPTPQGHARPPAAVPAARPRARRRSAARRSARRPSRAARAYTVWYRAGSVGAWRMYGGSGISPAPASARSIGCAVSGVTVTRPSPSRSSTRRSSPDADTTSPGRSRA